MKSHYFSCVDGRSSDEILGIWGGDTGHTLLSLAVYEELAVSHPLSFAFPPIVVMNFIHLNVIVTDSNV